MRQPFQFFPLLLQIKSSLVLVMGSDGLPAVKSFAKIKIISYTGIFQYSNHLIMLQVCK